RADAVPALYILLVSASTRLSVAQVGTEVRKQIVAARGSYMKLSLVVAEGVHKGKAIPIPVAQFVIGRDETCQLRPSSPAVSKRHCAVLVKGSEVFVQDFGSTNGTFINDQPVSGETLVKNGDKLVVGPLVFQIRVEAAAPPQAPTKGDSKLDL